MYRIVPYEKVTFHSTPEGYEGCPCTNIGKRPQTKGASEAEAKSRDQESVRILLELQHEDTWTKGEGEDFIG